MALLVVCLFLLLASYYAMKTSREALLLARGAFGLTGQELKAYASGLMACSLVLIVPAYSALVARVRRLRLIDISYAIAIGSLVGFYALSRAGVPIGLPLFVWIGLVNLILIAQFWSYANDLYTEDQGQRLFALIALGGSLGGILGPRLAELATSASLLAVAAALLVPVVILFHVIEHCHVPDPGAGDIGREPVAPGSAYELVRHDRYLALIAGIVFLGALVKTIGDYVLSDAAARRAIELVPAGAHAVAQREELIKAFYSDFFSWVNLVSFVIQAFVVSRAIEKLGVRRALFVMPVIALGSYGVIAIAGSFALVRVAKIAENSTDYSLENTVRQALFLPTDRAAKYHAKTAIDTFAVRAGDTLSALVIWLGVRELGYRGRDLAIVNLVLVALWLVVALGIVQYDRKRTRLAACNVEP